MRLFIAAELPNELLDALAETSAALRECVPGRFVSSNSFHVTLAFLGNTEGSRVRAIQQALECACAHHQAFQVQLGTFGSFGKRSKATLWQGFQRSEEFVALAKDVRSNLDRAGFSFDNKTFLPHVTLMRAADITCGILPAPVLESGTIEVITLFQSDLSGARPIYTPLYSVYL